MSSNSDLAADNSTRKEGTDVQLPCFVRDERAHQVFVEWHKGLWLENFIGIFWTRPKF